MNTQVTPYYFRDTVLDTIIIAWHQPYSTSTTARHVEDFSGIFLNDPGT